MASVPTTARGGAWREAVALASAHRSRLAFGLGLVLFERAAGLVLPASSKWLMDDVVLRGNWELLTTLSIVVAAATVCQSAAALAQARLLGVAAQRAIADLRVRVASHVLMLPAREFESTKVGMLITRIMSDADGIRNLLGTGLVQLAGAAVTATASLAVLMYLNWRLTLLTVAILGVFGAGWTLSFRRLRPLFRQRAQINGEVTGRLAEALGGIRIVKAFCAERHETGVFAAGANRLFVNAVSVLTGTAAVTAFSTLTMGAVGIGLMTVGGASIRSGAMTVGDFVMYLMFTGVMVGPVVQLASVGTQIAEAFAGLDRIREVFALPIEPAQQPGQAQLGTVRGDVAFHDVSFEYASGAPVLNRLSFEAPAGTTTALVGSSGSGKTTLAGLVMALHRPSSGTIAIDGVDIQGVSAREVRSHLGVVLQDDFLFDGSIADNIRYARAEATAEQIEAAGRLAHCHEFIARLPGGYDTVVGERGVKLSGGQRQRVAIARALLADPRILILDEATSSLDSESEALIQDALQALRHGRTTFVIAHRLSTIRSADQILVIEHGEIVERGRHDDLLAANGRYALLYRTQYARPDGGVAPNPAMVAAGAARMRRVNPQPGHRVNFGEPTCSV